MSRLRVTIPKEARTTAGKVAWGDGHCGFFGWLTEGFARIGASIDYTSGRHCRVNNGVRVIPIDIAVADKGRRCWFDYSEVAGPQYQIRDSRDLYFRVNLTHDDHAAGQALPVGQCASPYGGCEYLALLPAMRARRAKKRYTRDVLGLFRTGCDGMRAGAVRRLRQSSLNVLAGVGPAPGARSVLDDVYGGLLPFREHLFEQCQSRLCLSLPGEVNSLHLDWSWRHTEILGMGCNLVMIRPNSVWVGKPVDCWLEVERDLSDLTDACELYLSDDEALEQVAQNGMRYYSEWLAPEATAAYMVREVQARL